MIELITPKTFKTGVIFERDDYTEFMDDRVGKVTIKWHGRHLFVNRYRSQYSDTEVYLDLIGKPLDLLKVDFVADPFENPKGYYRCPLGIKRAKNKNGEYISTGNFDDIKLEGIGMIVSMTECDDIRDAIINSDWFEFSNDKDVDRLIKNGSISDWNYFE